MSTKTVKRAFKFRFYPTADQEQELIRTWGCVRLVYNKALDLRTKSWYQEQRRVSYAETDKALTSWKREDDLAFLNEVSSVPLQQGLRRLQAAFVNFFEKRAQYPKFKSRRKSKLSLTYSERGFRFDDEGYLYIAKMSDPLDIAFSQPFPLDTCKTVVVSRDLAHRWFISFSCEDEVEQRAVTGKTVGIDLGIKDALVLSTGEKINPDDQFEVKKKRNIIKRRQRQLSRKAKGSQNREKARLKLARAHVSLTDAKRDWMHKVTTDLVQRFDVISIEDLNVRGMTSAARGKGRKAKAGLNRGIMQNSFGELRTMLEYKADWYGGEVVAIDRYFPSTKLCSECGTVTESKPLSVRYWKCDCGAKHDRDVNAARNINAAGLAVYACGDGVRPAKKPLASSAGSRR